jgi:hypothetical protein
MLLHQYFELQQQLFLDIYRLCYDVVFIQVHRHRSSVASEDE